MALRFFSERIDGTRIERSAQGHVRVPAIVAKPGVYTYRRADGTSIREYLPPEEVIKADSLATLEDATVTMRHPPNMVDPKTWAQVSIGHARNARPDGTQAAATLVITRADAQADIGKSLVEVSRGVRVRVDNTPGITPEGEHYDAVQRDVVYNHIALGPSGWGRQGPQVSLRLDSAGDELIEHTDTDTKEITPMKYTDKTGKVYEFKTDSELQAFLDGQAAASAARADAGNPFAKKGEEDEDEDKKAKEKKDAADKLARERDAEKARADAAQAKLDAIEAAQRKDARAALETRAQGVLGKDWRADSAAKDRDVHLAVLAKLTPAVKYDSQSDAYVAAAFDIALSAAPANPGNRADSLAAGLHGVHAGGISPTQPGAPAPGARTDGLPEDPRERMIRRDELAWKA